MILHDVVDSVVAAETSRGQPNNYVPRWNTSAGYFVDSRLPTPAPGTTPERRSSQEFPQPTTSSADSAEMRMTLTDNDGDDNNMVHEKYKRGLVDLVEQNTLLPS